MSSNRVQNRPLSLNEILAELENNIDDPVPESIVFEPPDNANGNVTDEDSGEEDVVTLSNLPGSLLRAPAVANYGDHSSPDSDSEDDNLPLASISKRRRFDDQPPPLPPTTSNMDPHQSSSSTLPSTPLPSTSNVDPHQIQCSVPSSVSYQWRNRHRPNEFPVFEHVQGPKNEVKSPIYYFEQLYNDQVFELLLNYTNLYATQKNKQGNVTMNEMKCFIGILIYSGYVSLPRRRMYWENSSDCNFPLVNRALSRDRFTFILNHLHCCENALLLSTETDKFAKLRPLFSLLNKIYKEYAIIEEMHSIDEAMIPYYGGHNCKQFIRGKPIRWGYKYWVGATRLGYVIWFEPYQGQSAQVPLAYKRFGLGGSVILKYANVLQSMYPTVPFHLFFDNFFTSIPLLHELKNRNIKATGTIRENRVSKCPLPSNQEFKKTERGTYKYKASVDEQILVCKWNDNSVVTVASNAESIEPLHKAKRFSQHLKRSVLIDQPCAIKMYNENMGGVDRFDQNIGLYRTSIRGKKWYFPLFCHTIDMTLHNAWQLYRNDGGDMDHLSFRRSIARALLESYKRCEKRGPCPTPKTSVEDSRYDEKGHLIKYTEKILKCKLCKKNCNFICIKCNIHLHPKYCCYDFHMK